MAACLPPFPRRGGLLQAAPRCRPANRRRDRSGPADSPRPRHQARRSGRHRSAGALSLDRRPRPAHGGQRDRPRPCHPVDRLEPPPRVVRRRHPRHRRRLRFLHPHPGCRLRGPFVKSLLDRGWAVAVSDYQGLGTPGVPPTWSARPRVTPCSTWPRPSACPARACRRPRRSGSWATRRGRGAGWAAELAGTYAPELTTEGSAIGGVPGDLQPIAEFLDGRPSWPSPSSPPSASTRPTPSSTSRATSTPAADGLVATSQDLCLVSVDGFGALIDVAFTHIDDYVTTNPLDTRPGRPGWTGPGWERAAVGTGVFQYHALGTRSSPQAGGRPPPGPGATRAATSPGAPCRSPSTPSASSRLRPRHRLAGRPLRRKAHDTQLPAA